jgi:predicted phosphodiesterase
VSNWLEPIFDGTIILGRPTDSNITASVLGSNNLEIYFEYGTSSMVYTYQTDINSIQGGTPFEQVINNLQPNTRYYYRMRFRESGGTEFGKTAEYTFHTQRSAGGSFIFTVQSDSHLKDAGTNEDLYETTLRNLLSDSPDFHIDLGDTFMAEKLYPQTNEGALEAALNHRPFFDVIGRNAFLFLVNGNHDGELGWKRDSTPNNMAIWATHARQLYYPTPAPGGFYSGSNTADPNLNGVRDAYYSWQWGDALFIVLDPFWYTTTKPGDCWNWTLGQEQYNWLKDTLETSTAKFKFVFLHNLFGTSLGRGGIEYASYYEWGGKNADDTWGFNSHRPGWYKPIHDLLVENNVTIVFHGHDHLFIKQVLDGIVYQLTPKPSNRNYTNIADAEKFGYVGDVIANSGHLRVTVSPSSVTVDYVRAYLPQDQNDVRVNGQVAYSYTIQSK